jgi:PPOX class probable F420-dependent enzyme
VILTPAERDLLTDARRATLATIATDGRPRLVPICFVSTEDVLWSPIDEKPKAVDDPRQLARIRDITRDPRVTLLVDRWSEDWADLAWLRIEGRAELVTSADGVVQALRARYPQYADHDLEHRPMLRIAIDRATSWFASAADTNATRRTIDDLDAAAIDADPDDGVSRPRRSRSQ